MCRIPVRQTPVLYLLVASRGHLQADVTANDDQDKALLKEFGIFGPPAIIFYDANGVEQKNARVVGYMPADEFGTILDRVF